MTHKSAKLLTVLIMGASLSGCSTFSNMGQSLWSGTSKMTSSASRSVGNFFRGSPKVETGSDYVYGSSDATLNTRLLAQRIATQSSRGQPSRGLPVFSNGSERRINAAAHSRRIPQLRGRYQGYESYEASPSKVRPATVGYAAPHYEASIAASTRAAYAPSAYQSYPARRELQNTPQQQNAFQQSSGQHSSGQQSSGEQTGALSYVKIGGGSRMSDWKSCETQSGGYFRMGQTGYTVEPAFDNCMRGIGYITETEAEAKFAALETNAQMDNNAQFAP